MKALQRSIIDSMKAQTPNPKPLYPLVLSSTSSSLSVAITLSVQIVRRCYTHARSRQYIHASKRMQTQAHAAFLHNFFFWIYFILFVHIARAGVHQLSHAKLI